MDRVAIPAGENPFYLDAELMPAASLGRSGRWLIAGGVAATGLMAALLFVRLGAWPVAGFFGLDVVALALAFAIRARTARVRERVCLTPTRLWVARAYAGRLAGTGPNGLWSFEPAWLRVTIDRGTDGTEALRLSSHGHSLTIGGFLSPEERKSLAAALTSALDQWRRGIMPPRRRNVRRGHW